MVSSSFWMLFFHPIRIHSWRAIHPIPTGHLCGGVGRPCKEANAGEFKDPGGLLQHTADGAPAVLVDHRRGVRHSQAPVVRLEHRVIDGVGRKALAETNK